LNVTTSIGIALVFNTKYVIN